MNIIDVVPAAARSSKPLALGALLAALCLPILSRPAFSQALALDDDNSTPDATVTSNQTVFFVGIDSNLYEFSYPFAAGDWSQLTGVNGTPAMAAQTVRQVNYIPNSHTWSTLDLTTSTCSLTSGCPPKPLF